MRNISSSSGKGQIVALIEGSLACLFCDLYSPCPTVTVEFMVIGHFSSIRMSSRKISGGE